MRRPDVPKAPVPRMPADVSALCRDEGRGFFLERVGRHFIDAPPSSGPGTCATCGKHVDVTHADNSGSRCTAQYSIGSFRKAVVAKPPKLDKDGNPLGPKVRKDGSPAVERGTNNFGKRTGVFVDAHRAIVVCNVAPARPLPPGITQFTEGTDASLRRLYEAAFLQDFTPDALFVLFDLKSHPMALTKGRSSVMLCGTGDPVPVDVALVRDLHALMREYGTEKVSDFVACRSRVQHEGLAEAQRRAAHDRFCAHLDAMPDAERWRVSLPDREDHAMSIAKVLAGGPAE